MPVVRAISATGEGIMRRPRPAGASGRVRTATTSCGEARMARSEGTATSGVPANRTRVSPGPGAANAG